MTTLNTTKVDKWDLSQLQSFLNVNTKDFKLLMEAYRRKNLLDTKPKSIDDTMLGLGSPHQYRSKFFTVNGKETPKVNNWYGLTTSGKGVMKEIEKVMPIPTDAESKNKLNRLLFSY